MNMNEREKERKEEEEREKEEEKDKEIKRERVSPAEMLESFNCLEEFQPNETKELNQFEDRQIDKQSESDLPDPPNDSFISPLKEIEVNEVDMVMEFSPCRIDLS
jgi:hypothetical protein